LIFQRLLLAFTAIVAIATAAAIALVAASFAIFALARPYVGDAGASGVVCGVYALLVLIGGIAAIPRKRRRVRSEGPTGVAEDLMELVRDKPMASAGVALAAGIMAMRNPRVIGEIARAFFANRRERR
jgi:hypothetical protein